MRFSAKHELVVAALLQIQREVQPIVKDAKNSHLGTKYATLGAITDYVRPLLAKYELFVMQGFEKPEAGTLAASMLTRITHSSGQWVENRVCSPMADASGKAANVQIAGSITTYLRRYGLSAILALTTDEDDDGNAGTKQRKAARAMSREINTQGVTKPTDVPFPPMKGLKEFQGKPLKDVPTAAITEAYTRASTDESKTGQAVAKAMEDELERRRDQDDPTSLHPALREG